MARHADPYRVRCAQMAGALAAIRDALMLDHEDRLMRLREVWPELADCLDAAVELVDSG